jgi:predicted GIY-YIG superfamily endonuclease
MGTIYLIHFGEKIHHAGHYLGFTDDLLTRLEQHRKGRGARLMQVVCEHDIDWILVRTWLGTRKLKRQLKNRKNSPQLCPICQALKAEPTYETKNDQKP